MNAPVRQFEPKQVPIAELIPYEGNARTHSETQVQQIVNSMLEFGWTNPLLIDELNRVIAGHGRLLAAQVLGMTTAPCLVVDGLDDARRRALIIADNKIALNAGWDEAKLAAELMAIGDLVDIVGFTEDELALLLGGAPGDGSGMDEEQIRLTLAERFGLPPFSVLDARKGWWQDRKSAWVALGIKSEVGRGETAGSKLTMSDTVQRLKPQADQALVHSRARNATPGKHAMPATNYSKSGKRGNGRGRPTELI